MKSILLGFVAIVISAISFIKMISSDIEEKPLEIPVDRELSLLKIQAENRMSTFVTNSKRYIFNQQQQQQTITDIQTHGKKRDKQNPTRWP